VEFQIMNEVERQVAPTRKSKALVMKGFVADIEELTEENSDFRRVVYTGKNLQLVLMAIQPGEEVGEETHADRDQFFRVEKGKGEVWIDGHHSKVRSDDAIIVPAGARHNIVNTGDDALHRGGRRGCAVYSVSVAGSGWGIGVCGAQSDCWLPGGQSKRGADLGTD
jgi:mannose-6-phosphate isomerase-like protein (cupin superfamily)